VDCQVEHICGRPPADLEGALAELPKTLDETYERTLRGIQEADWAFAHRVFQFVAVASRPLCVKELAGLFAFDFNAGSTPKFDEDSRLEDPADAVLSACTTLLSIVDSGHRWGNVIQFSHFSVKEFLTSTRLGETTDTISRRYHISMTPAHTFAAQVCLGILLHLDKDVITRNSLEDFPLAKYAAAHWADHAQFEDVSRNVEDGMKQLFDPSRPHLAAYVWIYDPAFPRWRGEERGERPLPLHQTPLHYAASWGLHFIVELLVTELSQNVSSQRFSDNATPLHLASENGHIQAACKLIECGADVTAQDNDVPTALHLASLWGHVDVARILIERGADVTTQDNNGWTPLHQASFSGQVDVARMLIECGANLTARDNIGQTALHLALQEKEVDVARILIERGADVTTQDDDGWTPLHRASFLGLVDVTCMLIERGADVTARDNRGDTPLHLALREGEVDIACILIECGADVTTQDNNGWSLLHWMSFLGQVDVARMLIERGADVTAQSNCGETPLHVALREGEVNIARILIECGGCDNLGQ
jgi:ankyrin repeat protein